MNAIPNQPIRFIHLTKILGTNFWLFFRMILDDGSSTKLIKPWPIFGNWLTDCKHSHQIFGEIWINQNGNPISANLLMKFTWPILKNGNQFPNQFWYKPTKRIHKKDNQFWTISSHFATNSGPIYQQTNLKIDENDSQLTNQFWYNPTKRTYKNDNQFSPVSRHFSTNFGPIYPQTNLKIDENDNQLANQFWYNPTNQIHKTDNQFSPVSRHFSTNSGPIQRPINRMDPAQWPMGSAALDFTPEI